MTDVLVMGSRRLDQESERAASNLHTLLLQRIARQSQVQVAEAAGIEKTKMHRIVCGERGLYLDELEPFLRAVGLAVIECEGDVLSVPEEELLALRSLAKLYFSEPAFQPNRGGEGV